MNTIIAWFARNGVAANLLAALILIAGLLTIGGIRREIFPEVESGMVSVEVEYPGSAPAEVEEGICIRIEEAIESLEGIKKITSFANEGFASVTVELLPDAEVSSVLDDIKVRVDEIDTFPEESEKPVIQELLLRKQVINVALAGDVSELALKKLGERVRDDLATLPSITQVELSNVRPYEISIEVSEYALKRYNLRFDDIADAIRRSSLDLPGGSVRTEGGEILLRTKGQAYHGDDFRRILVRTNPDGTRLTVGDVATVIDGFAETDQEGRFDGFEQGALVQVFRVGDQNALDISAAVMKYVEEHKAELPPGIMITTWQDDSSYLLSRQQLLLKNGLMGLCLVFMILALFLRFTLAIWVTVGLLISFMGTFWVMPWLDVSINLLSLFAFILVLGIVVDDAIVVSENIHTHQQQSEGGLSSSIAGAQEVSKPVIFAVMTTVAAFFPLLTVPGTTGKIMRVIPLIVIPTLLFSLVESLFVLPNHLSHQKLGPGSSFARTWISFQNAFDMRVQWFINSVYKPLLEKALEWRYLTLTTSITVMMLTMGLVAGGWIKFVFFPPVEGDNVAAVLTMPLGTPASVTDQAVGRVESAALKLRDRIDAETPADAPSVFRHVLASVGEQPFLKTQQEGAGKIVQSFSSSHLGEIHIELAPSESRTMSSAEIARLWRELTDPITGAVELTFTSSIFSTGDPIDIQLTGSSFDTLKKAAEELKSHLAGYGGVKDISDSFREGKQEIKLQIKPEAEALGLSLMDLGRQVRQAFYGEEAQRIQRGRDEVKVMVRLPEEDRKSLDSLHTMRIRTPQGAEIPFNEVAIAEMGRGYASIKRVNRNRTINVTADVDLSEANTTEIIADLDARFLPELMARYPGISSSFEGEQREQQETIQGILSGFPLAMILIYALLAVPFRSYLQPFIVMSAIPFGLVGAVLGHVLMGMELTILSMFGIVALAGVVVNDNLVLVDFINRKRDAGLPLFKAVREAGTSRFRPILLTSLTTFAGLIPLILEKSVQAKFLIPMAVSLGFGVMFATAISLLMVPALYLILEDILVLLSSRSNEHHFRETGLSQDPETT